MNFRFDLIDLRPEEDTNSDNDTATASSQFINVHIRWIIAVIILLCSCSICLLSLIIWQIYYVQRTRKDLTEKMQEMTVQLDKIQSVDSPEIDGPHPDSTTSPQLIFQSNSAHNPTGDSTRERDSASPRASSPKPTMEQINAVTAAMMDNRSIPTMDSLQSNSRPTLQRSATDKSNTRGTGSATRNPYGLTLNPHANSAGLNRPLSMLTHANANSLHHNSPRGASGVNFNHFNGRTVGGYHSNVGNVNIGNPGMMTTQRSNGSNPGANPGNINNFGVPHNHNNHSNNRVLKIRSKTYGTYVAQRQQPLLRNSGNILQPQSVPLQPQSLHQQHFIPHTPLSTTSSAGLSPVHYGQNAHTPHSLPSIPTMPQMTKSQSDPEEKRRSSTYRGSQQNGIQILRPIQLPTDWRTISADSPMVNPQVNGVGNMNNTTISNISRMQQQVSFAASTPIAATAQSLVNMFPPPNLSQSPVSPHSNTPIPSAEVIKHAKTAPAGFVTVDNDHIPDSEQQLLSNPSGSQTGVSSESSQTGVSSSGQYTGDEEDDDEESEHMAVVVNGMNSINQMNSNGVNQMHGKHKMNGLDQMNPMHPGNQHHAACAQFQNLTSATPIMYVANSNAKALDRMRQSMDRARSGTAVSAVSALTDVSDSEMNVNGQNEDIFGTVEANDDAIVEDGAQLGMERVLSTKL